MLPGTRLCPTVRQAAHINSDGSRLWAPQVVKRRPRIFAGLFLRTLLWKCDHVGSCGEPLKLQLPIGRAKAESAIRRALMEKVVMASERVVTPVAQKQRRRTGDRLTMIQLSRRATG
jgi:hypothetical protein